MYFAHQKIESRHFTHVCPGETLPPDSYHQSPGRGKVDEANYEVPVNFVISSLIGSINRFPCYKSKELLNLFLCFTYVFRFIIKIY